MRRGRRLARNRRSVLAAATLLLAAALGGSARATRWDPDGDRLVCHRAGTPDEKVLRLPPPAVRRHLAHGDARGRCPSEGAGEQPGGEGPDGEGPHPIPSDLLIDADGTASPDAGGAADREIEDGALLARFPFATKNNAGLGWFDRDGDGRWSPADDLHVEGEAFCTWALRNGFHDLGWDCVVLDVGRDLVDGLTVTCDLEYAVGRTTAPCPPPGLAYHDRDGNGAWDDGEDLVLDTNGNGLFD